MTNKKDTDVEYGYHIELKLVHGVLWPVKVYDPQRTPEDRGAAPRRLNQHDFVTAGLDRLIED